VGPWCELNIKTKLLKNTIVNYLIQFWTWAVAFFLFPLIVHYLGTSAAGIWLLVNSLTRYFSILDLGIGPSLTKYVAQYRAQEDEERLSQSIGTTFFIYLAMGLLTAIGLFILGYFFIALFNIPTELVQKGKIITYITAATMLLAIPMGTFGGVLRGLQRYDIPALADFSVSIPRILLILLLLPRGYGVVTLVLINSLSSVLSWVVNAYYTKKLLPFLRISFSLFNKEMVKTLFGLAVSLFLINVSMMIVYPTDRIIIGAFLPVGLIIFYEAAYMIYHLVRKAPQLLASAVIPAASELDTKRDTRSLQMLFLKGTKYMTAFFLALAIPALLLSKEMLTCWMGSEFGSYYLLTVIFILHLFFNYNHLFAFKLLAGMNKVTFTLWYYLTSALLNLVLSLILVQKIGLIGVVLGTAIPYAVLEPVFIWYNLKTFHVNLSTYIKEVIGKIYPQGVIMALLLYLFKSYFLPRSVLAVGIFVFFSATTYLVLFYIFGIKDREKRDLLAMGNGLFFEMRQRLANSKLFW
jgi:O-antigen/teichoic acid export membrane protein